MGFRNVKARLPPLGVWRAKLQRVGVGGATDTPLPWAWCLDIFDTAISKAVCQIRDTLEFCLGFWQSLVAVCDLATN